MEGAAPAALFTPLHYIGCNHQFTGESTHSSPFMPVKLLEVVGTFNRNSSEVSESSYPSEACNHHP